MPFLKNIFTGLLRIYSSFFYFLFFKYFESVNTKIANFKIRWGLNPSNFDEFHQIC
jgi:hypothetical protein